MARHRWTRRLDEDVRAMSAERMREVFTYPSTGEFVIEYVLRAVVLQLIERRSARPEEWTFQGGVRDLYHEEAEPLLARLAPEERLADEYGRFAATLARMVQTERRVTYTRLNVTDHLWENRRIGVQRPHVLLVGEKKGMVRLLRRIHEAADISTLAMSGMPNAVTSEYTAAHVSEAMARAGLAGPVRLVALVDYDPFGARIARTLAAQLEGAGIGDVTLESPFGPHWLTPEELERGRFPARHRAPQHRALFRDWLAHTGGIAGEPFGVAVDAMAIERLQTRLMELLVHG